MTIDDADRPAASGVRTHATRRQGFRKTWLAWGLLLMFSAAGWMRALDAWVDWQWLSLAGVEPGPAYLVISGAVWGVLGLLSALVLLLRLRHGRAIALSGVVLIALAFWLDRLLFSYAPNSGGNTLFALLVTVVLLAAVFQSVTAPEERRLFHRG